MNASTGRTSQPATGWRPNQAGAAASARSMSSRARATSASLLPATLAGSAWRSRRYASMSSPKPASRAICRRSALINAERRQIAREAGFGDDIDAYRRHLQADPANVAESSDALVARAREDIERALAAAPAWFGRLPVAACDVRPVDAFMERDAPFAYYYPPAIDGSRPGIYYVNTYDLPHRFLSTLGTTTYHEAVPGHHFQIALEMEHPDLPAFRRLGSRLVGGAYAEGWGLYAERLADEMGLFRSEGERFGMLTAQAWRAARLIVDTGIHALRKDRAWGVQTLLDAGLTETDASIETDRYITWPGQALTYNCLLYTSDAADE